MARFRKDAGGSTDVPLADGTCIAVLGPLPESGYDREDVGPMFRVLAVDGVHAGTHFTLFDNEIEKE